MNERENERVPSVAQWLLERLLPADVESLIGDLAEAYGTRRGRDGRRAADRWYWREVATTLLWIGFSRLARRRLTGFALLTGLLAGGLTIVAGVKGPGTVLGYAGLLLVVALRLSVASNSFRVRFAVATAAFMTLTAFLYVYIAALLVGPLPAAGHLWRLGLMLLIGSVAGALTAWVSGDSLGARLSLPAAFLPWIPYSFWLLTRSRWENVPPTLKILLPWEALTRVVPSLSHYAGNPGWWPAIAINTALWILLARSTAVLVQRSRAAQ